MILISFSSCKKKEALPQNQDADPVFYLDGTINGNKVLIQAGKDGYYMHSSFSQDDNNIYVFRGDLSSDCVSSCGYSLSVLINDRTISSLAADVKIDSALVLGTYNLTSKDFYPTEQIVSFVPKEAKSALKQYTWTVSDASGEILSLNTYSFTSPLKIASSYTVSYTYEDVTGGCSGSHSNVYFIGSKFRTWMTIQKNGTDFAFNAATDKTGEYSYSWDFGDGEKGDGIAVSHQFQNQGIYNVKLVSTDKLGNSSVCYYEVNTNPNACESNFVAKFTPLDYSKILKSITFLLKDDKGQTYSSADAPLIAGSTAEIISIEDYTTNNQGQNTKKIKLSFNCGLKGDAGIVKIENATAVIAVAY